MAGQSAARILIIGATSAIAEAAARQWAARGASLFLVGRKAERLQNLRLDKMADARLSHNRDGNGLDDPLDHLRVAHARHAAVLANVGRHALQRHDCARPGFLGDARLLPAQVGEPLRRSIALGSQGRQPVGE